MRPVSSDVAPSVKARQPWKLQSHPARCPILRLVPSVKSSRFLATCPLPAIRTSTYGSAHTEFASNRGQSLAASPSPTGHGAIVFRVGFFCVVDEPIRPA